MTTARDDKRTEELKLRLTERELLDLSRLAAVAAPDRPEVYPQSRA